MATLIKRHPLIKYLLVLSSPIYFKKKGEARKEKRRKGGWEGKMEGRRKGRGREDLNTKWLVSNYWPTLHSGLLLSLLTIIELSLTIPYSRSSNNPIRTKSHTIRTNLSDSYKLRLFPGCYLCEMTPPPASPGAFTLTSLSFLAAAAYSCRIYTCTSWPHLWAPCWHFSQAFVRD